TPHTRGTRRFVSSAARTTVRTVKLDASQTRAVRLPRGRHLLVLGDAGHGKTTVALHRLGHLLRAAPHDAELRVAFVVPTDALRRMLEQLARTSGVDAP